VLPWRTATLGVGFVLVLAILVHAYSTLPGVRDQPGFSPAYDGWVQCGGYVLCVLLALTFWPDAARARWAWGLVVVYLALRATAFVVAIVHVRPLAAPPYPSWADYLWLSADAALLAALAIMLSRKAPRLSRTLVLDALAAALTVSAVVVARLYDPLVAAASSNAPRAAIVTNLAYPLVDVAMLTLVGAMVVVSESRASFGNLALLAGVAGTAVVDAVYLYRLAEGTFRPGSYLASLSLVATATIAASGAARRRLQREQPERAAGLAVPAVLAAVCVLVLTVPPEPQEGAKVFAGLAILVAIVRGLTTLQIDRAASSEIIAAGAEEVVQFKSVVEAASTFIAIAELDGTVAYVNPAGRRMVGLDPDADVRKTVISDYLTEEGIRASIEVEQPAVVAEGHWEGESTLRRMDGGPPIPVEIYSFLVRHPETGDPWLLATAQRDISEKLATERALRDLAEQRQRLLSDLVEAQEEERSRIAADIHDDSVQALAAVELRLLVLHRQLARAAPQLVEQCEELSTTVRTATGRLRHLLFDLDSPAQRSDLRTAIEEAAAYILQGDVRWRVEGQVDAPEAIRVVAYRIVKEALTNVHKHAAAQQVLIGLTEVDGGLGLTVSDDGRGTSQDLMAPRPGHMGVRGMRERAAGAGGRLEIDSRVGEGTTITLWLPYRPVEDGDHQEAS
jgi:PAS domain S-box-containing protein